MKKEDKKSNETDNEMVRISLLFPKELRHTIKIISAIEGIHYSEYIRRSVEKCAEKSIDEHNLQEHI